MKLQDLGGYKNLYDLISGKIQAYGKNPTQFSTLFNLMFSERENVMVETMVGYRIKGITYGEIRERIKDVAVALEGVLSSCPKNTFIGLDMCNGVEWIQAFWGILMAGYKPLLINSRLPSTVLEKALSEYSVQAVISDRCSFTACPTYMYNEMDIPTTQRKESDFTFGTEVIFMSSGTQGEIKLCAYTSERFYYQICDTYYIVKDCPQIRKGCEGKIKQLALLPFYHVFGFMAVYLWFGFFSRTFVFLKDLSPQTLVNTARRHKVTHIFAVPLVWETVYKTAMKTIQSKGEKIVKKVQKGLRIAQSGKLGKRLTYKAFGEVREQIFGDSVRFLISGGSSIAPEAVSFLNAIGYHIANGYGMTELGITSVELSLSDKTRNTLSIGKPFRHAEYKCEKGELFVKSDTRATRILYKGKEQVTDFADWFPTGDLATEKDGRFFIDGRKDDLIVSETGENLNPNIIEKLFKTDGVEELCLFRGKDGMPTLILSCPKVFSKAQAQAVRKNTEQVVGENSLGNEIRRIVLTSSSLMGVNDFKISRKKVAERYEQNVFKVLDEEKLETGEMSELQRRIRSIFAKVLQKEENEIGLDENFFSSLGGNSLDYFTLIGFIKEEFSTFVPVDEAQTLSTVRALVEYIQRRDL